MSAPARLVRLLRAAAPAVVLASVVVAPLAFIGPGCARHANWPAAPFTPSVSALEAHRTSPHAYARAGDLVLHGDEGTGLVVAARVSVPGHRPLRGSVVDVLVDATDRSDPLLWWRPGFRDEADKVHVLVASDVEKAACAGGDGIRARGTIDGATITTTFCAERGGRYRVTSEATGLPAGAELVDELNPGTSPALVDAQGAAWEGDLSSRFLALGEHGVALLLELPGATPLRRKLVHIATETFPAPILVRYGGASATRVLHVLQGDALDALARSKAATRTLDVGLGEAGGSFSLLSQSGREIATGHAAAGSARVLKLPPDFGASVALRDGDGVPLGAPRNIAGGAAPEKAAPTAPRGVLDLAITDEAKKPIAAHVLFRGLGGTPDPMPAGGARAFAAGPSLYLVDGAARVPLAPGRYEVIATHGLAHSLVRREIEVKAGATVAVAEVLRRVVDAAAWTAADFHLHAAPSPDAPVALEERVASLACEGVDLAVATDHNHITDYAGAARRLGTEATLSTVIGDEITSSGATLWGHFNAFPLPLPPATALPEEGTPPYFDVAPAELFARARKHGAAVLQVNHPRMPPRIGYFDLTHLDPATGAADAAFSQDFDAVEAHNGIWLESPERVREGVRDLVALARRGMRPAATGNSDSHRLLFEEAGYPRTYVHTPREPVATRAARVVAALKRGDTSVSSGPLVELEIDGNGIGSVVRPGAAKSVRAKVRVSAPAWVPVESVEVWLDDAVVQRFAVPGPAKDGVRFETEVVLPIAHDSVILAWAEAETPLPPVLPYPRARAIGFTGLVYVDADGDGKVVPPPAAPHATGLHSH